MADTDIVELLELLRNQPQEVSVDFLREAVSIAALSREMGINRTTVYYHFDSREALLEAVTSWATSIRIVSPAWWP